MATRMMFKDYFIESRLVNNRIIFSVIVSFLLFSLVIGRLVYLQVYEFDHYESLSDRNRVDIVPLPPQRGQIFDRNGVILAENIPTFSLELVPEQVKDIEQTLTGLAKLVELSEADIEEFKTRLKHHRRFQQVVVRQRLTEEEVARFAANRYHFAGVDVVGRLIRHYPQQNLFAHVVGYVGRINELDLQRIDQQAYKGMQQIGKTGVERSYEEQLLGEVGYRQIESNVQGREVRELVREPSMAGDDIYLHVDSNFQRIASEALQDYNGSVVMIDPRNGGVLAMVSKPDFDPNAFVSGISKNDYALLRDSPDRPLFNRSIRGRYPPGSTLKPFVALAGLELNVVNKDSTTHCPGWYSLPGGNHRYRCWRKHGHGLVSLKASIAQSCDVYFYDLAHALGIDRLYQFLDLFGFGRLTGIDLPGESKGLSPSSEWKLIHRNRPWYPGETLISGIGQGFNQTTPLQLAYATSTLAMRGVAYQPHVVRAVKSASGTTMRLISKQPPESLPMQNSKNWEIAIDAMVEVVHGKWGTARDVAKKMPFKIAGKTGTSQVFGIGQDEKYDAETLERKLHDHALFIAFAPADKPEIVVVVVVENGGSGSKIAAPIASNLIAQYFGITDV